MDMIKISEVHGYENNSRTHSQEQIEKICNSIEEFGFTNPILIDEKNMIIAGHGRVMSAKKLGIEKVPFHRLTHLTEIQKKAYVIADNKLALDAGWDEKLLLEELENLKNLDFDVSLTGFSDIDINEIMSGLEEEKEVVEDEAPSVQENPISKLGDIWTLGNHRVMCGDSTDAGTVALLMNGEKADMVFTDPPYLMKYEGSIDSDGTRRQRHEAIKNDKMSKEDGEKFLDKINTIIKEFCIGAFYITFYRLGIDWYFESMKRTGLRYRNLIIWAKNNFNLSNSDYKSKYEPMFYGWNEQHNFYGIKGEMDIWEINKTKINDLHPTMKPIELCARAIKNSSLKQNIVLDLFLGSGSTLIACEQLDRKCFGLELDEKYIDVILKRWQKLTGKDAIRQDGKTYNELS